MTLKNNDYSSRIKSAPPAGLMMINFELAINNLREALTAFAANDAAVFNGRLSDAREFLNLLMTSLDMSYDISTELMRLYIFINGLIIGAGVSKSSAPTETALDLLSKIAADFEAAAESDGCVNAAASDANARQVYAGLTYKDGKLSEYIEEDAERGFLA